MFKHKNFRIFFQIPVSSYESQSFMFDLFFLLLFLSCSCSFPVPLTEAFPDNTILRTIREKIPLSLLHTAHFNKFHNDLLNRTFGGEKQFYDVTEPENSESEQQKKL